jgi:hypothetical protein
VRWRVGAATLASAGFEPLLGPSGLKNFDEKLSRGTSYKNEGLAIKNAHLKINI